MDRGPNPFFSPRAFMRRFNYINGPIFQHLRKGPYSRYFWPLYWSMLKAEIKPFIPEAWRLKRAGALLLFVLIIIIVNFLLARFL